MMMQILDAGARLLPEWLEVVASDDGQYRVLDSSFDDGAMELACFANPDRALQFARRLAERRSVLLRSR